MRDQLQGETRGLVEECESHCRDEERSPLSTDEDRPGGLSDIQLSEECWDTFWPEVNELAKEHFEEVDGDVEPRRKLKVHSAKMRAANVLGYLRVYSARRDGNLLGYITWQVMEDVESAGLLIANQGAWFVSRRAKSQSIGFKLFEFSISALQQLGVQCCYPHHRMQGRGRNLGKFFLRRGAKEIKHEFSLWIGAS